MTITSRVVDAELHISWVESLGPPIETVPEANGFGTRLTQMSVERQLGGTIERAFDRSGFRFEARIPVKSLSLALAA